MITPCACRGSGAHVHTDCLRRWRVESDEAARRCGVCGAAYVLVACSTSTALARTAAIVLHDPEYLDVRCALAGAAILVGLTGGHALMMFYGAYGMRAVLFVVTFNLVSCAFMVRSMMFWVAMRIGQVVARVAREPGEVCDAVPPQQQ